MEQITKETTNAVTITHIIIISDESSEFLNLTSKLILINCKRSVTIDFVHKYICKMILRKTLKNLLASRFKV